ncbi:MAG: hypothetical protein QOE70_3709 [Chthoniobacter sp.]|jgi:hypothetical protein|nr:hypothetical protein [Chthoniobacter sp.]
MKPWSEITHYAGFDWAKDHHDVVIVDRAGQIVADCQIQHTAQGWQHWRAQVAKLGTLAAAVETSQGVVVEHLLESTVTVYPVSPASAKRYRERKCPAATRPTASMPGVSPMRCASMAMAGKPSPKKTHWWPSCACSAATKSP